MGRNRGTSVRAMRPRWTWLAIALAYGTLRVALAGAFLADYGLNVRVFAAIEIASSAILGVAGGRLAAAAAMRELRTTAMFGALAVAGYCAPDTYVLLYSGSFPRATMLVVIAVIAIGASVSMVSVVSRVRTHGRSVDVAGVPAMPGRPT